MVSGKSTTPTRPSSLSEVLPAGLTYFYGFPSGQHSRFLNRCPGALEELVAMRAAVCAGPETHVIVYPSTCTPAVRSFQEHVLGGPLPREDQLHRLPSTLEAHVEGLQRNEALISALPALVAPGRLLMAQPLLDEALLASYALNPEVIESLNDKASIPEWVPERWRIPELKRAPNGPALAEWPRQAFPLPCVVKASRASAGDGVAVCRTLADVQEIQHRLATYPEPILLQAFIDKVDELDIKFAVYPNAARPPALVGASHECTRAGGGYLGGIIPEQAPAQEAEIFRVLSQHILPRFMQLGWYGVGGVDVLIDAEGHFYFSDFNCRMTGCMAQTLQKNAGVLSGVSVLVFNGTFEGDGSGRAGLEVFRQRFSRLARRGDSQQLLNVVALAEAGASVRIHGGVLFDQPETLEENLHTLTRLGIVSSGFEGISIGPFHPPRRQN